jgi:uncharacterized protein
MPVASFHIMDVLDVALDLPDQHPVVTLQEVEAPLRAISFPMGLPEGIALATAMRQLDSPRPMTHELFVNVLKAMGVDVVAVRLVGRTGGVYLADAHALVA